MDKRDLNAGTGLTIWAQSKGGAKGALIADCSRISWEDPEWEDLSPEGESFTLQLNQAEEDGSPKNFYHLLFCFAVPKPANPFTDVSEDAYYYKAVLWAREKGITAGMRDNLFGPNEICSRAQVVTFLYAYNNSLTPAEP